MSDWAVADAKNRFSELITKALTEGPQRVRRRGEGVVVMSEAEFEKLKPPEKDFIEHLMSGPSFEGLDLERSQDLSRNVDFGEDE